MKSPEFKRDFSKFESVFDHSMLSIVYATALFFQPRAVLKVLVTEGPKGIGAGYRSFSHNMRPVLYFLPPKK